MDNNSFEHINIDPERLNTSSESNIPTNDDIDSLDLKEQKRERYSQDTKYRKHLAIWVMWVVSIWLATVLLIIIAVAIWDLPMESNVQITLLATTTVNVLGLAYIVLKGIFKQ
ncbi:MAG: hypothetical protein J6B46_05545 [Parabacteroides sp.]|nr:hypothetical protein [Parabacteroides sp.]